MKAEEKISTYFDKAISFLSKGKYTLANEGKESGFYRTQIDVVTLALMFQLDEYFHHDKREEVGSVGDKSPKKDTKKKKKAKKK